MVDLPGNYEHRDNFGLNYKRKSDPAAPLANMPAEPSGAWQVENSPSQGNPAEQSGDISSLLNHLPGVAYRCRHDQDWTMEFITQGCLELTGYSPNDLLQNKIISYGLIVDPDDRDLAAGKMVDALHQDSPYDVTYRITTQNGEEKWVRDMGRGLLSSQNGSQIREGFITDITPQKLSEKRISRQIQRFKALRRIDIAITASFDLRITLNILLNQITTLLKIDAADVLLYNPRSQLLEFEAGYGFRTSALRYTRLRLGEGIAGQAALQRQTISISDRSVLQEEFRRAPELENENFAYYLGIPLIAKGQVKGILEIFHRSAFAADRDWMEFLEALAGQAAIAIDNATLFHDLQLSNDELNLAYDATLEGWSKALELRDRETEGHTKRVTEMTLKLAEIMRIGNGQFIHIRRGALLHDIGKLGIPDYILHKKGPLSPEEWEIMRQHPIYAYQLLSPIPNLRPAIDIPLCHHEKWDGSGYPHGLQGEKIPAAARIFAIIDVWDALLSDRPYRPAWSREKAISYIKEQSGKHFEPQVVAHFLEII